MVPTWSAIPHCAGGLPAIWQSHRVQADGVGPDGRRGLSRAEIVEGHGSNVKAGVSEFELRLEVFGGIDELLDHFEHHPSSRLRLVHVAHNLTHEVVRQLLRP